MTFRAVLVAFVCGAVVVSIAIAPQFHSVRSSSYRLLWIDDLEGGAAALDITGDSPGPGLSLSWCRNIPGFMARSTRQGLPASLELAGFTVEHLTDFNRASVPGWWLNGRVLKRRSFPRVQLKALDMAAPVLRRIDHFLPYGGQSLIAVARRLP